MTEIRVSLTVKTKDDRPVPAERVSAWLGRVRHEAISLHEGRAHTPGDERAAESGWAYIASVEDLQVEAQDNLPAEDARTHVTTHDDGTFLRTAIQPNGGPRSGQGSIDVLGHNGERLCQLNVFTYENGNVIVDTIDVDDRYEERNALTFRDGGREFLPTDKVISADLRGVKS